jgi:NADPH:quinone reductase-like Zn-dependent oxidoreductase
MPRSIFQDAMSRMRAANRSRSETANAGFRNKEEPMSNLQAISDRVETETRAAYITEFGAPELIRYGSLPIPAMGPTDVLVRTEAVAVNPVDCLIRAGIYRTPTPFPFVVGRDLAGVVVAAGPGAVGVTVGDRVWSNSLGHGGRQGSFSEHVVVAADRCYQRPEGVSPSAAVAVAHPAATAYLALFRQAQLQPGETVFVGGGGGNVGRAAVELAAAAGARVIASARAEDFDDCTALGASAVVDYREGGAALAKAAPQGVDVYLETSGQHDFTAALRVLAPGGRIVLMAGTATVPLPVSALFQRNARLLGFVISDASISDLAAAGARINERLAAGGLKARIASTLKLADAAEAHRIVEKRTVRGRIVLQP